MRYHLIPVRLKRDYSGGPVVGSLPSNAGDAGSNPGWGTRMPHAARQLSPRATTTELAHLSETAHVSETTEPTRSGARVPQLERENPHSTTREKSMHCNKEPTCHN